MCNILMFLDKVKKLILLCLCQVKMFDRFVVSGLNWEHFKYPKIRQDFRQLFCVFLAGLNSGNTFSIEYVSYPTVFNTLLQFKQQQQ